jgi:hypothetical protein
MDLSAHPDELRAVLAKVRQVATATKRPVPTETLAAIWRDVHADPPSCA